MTAARWLVFERLNSYAEERQYIVKHFIYKEQWETTKGLDTVPETETT